MNLNLTFLFALVALTAAAKTTTTLRYMPVNTKLLQQQQQQPQGVADEHTKNYENQDSRGFYSYGYSGDSSAKAEYVAVDGSSRGFYAYVDADGQLQTVKYEAGKGQGFTAAGTNLPLPQANSEQLVPMPVKDTPEVEAAREAHFAAYAKAAALAEQQQDNIEQARLARKRKLKQQEQQLQDQLQEQKQIEANGEGTLEEEGETGETDVSEELRKQIVAILARERGMSSAQAARQQNEQQAELSDERSYDKENQLMARQQKQVQQSRVVQNARSQAEELSNQMTSITMKGSNSGSSQKSVENSGQNMDNILTLRTLYSLQDDNSNSYFKFADLSGALDPAGISDTDSELQPRVLSETVRVPVNSYYTVLSPSAKYSVNTATVLKNVPRSEAQRLGHSLPISLSSTFQAQRLNLKRD